GDDRRLWCGRDQHRLPGLDRDTDRPGKNLPELARGRVSFAQLLNDTLDLRIVARIVRNNATPGADGSAKPGAEFAALAELPFCRRDLGVRRLVQHFAGDDAVRLELHVADPLKSRIGFELPLLAGEPGQHDG